MARKHVYEFGNTAFLQGAGAAVVMTEDVGFLEDKKFTVTTVIPAKGSTVAKKEFKSNLAYGDGLTVFRRTKSEGEIKIDELLPDDAPEIFQFLSDSNYMRVMQEVAADLVVFGDAFVHLSFGKRLKNDKPRVVQIWHREMCFSRISKQDDVTKRIEYHGYSSQWGEQSAPGLVRVQLCYTEI